MGSQKALKGTGMVKCPHKANTKRKETRILQGNSGHGLSCPCRGPHQETAISAQKMSGNAENANETKARNGPRLSWTDVLKAQNHLSLGVHSTKRTFWTQPEVFPMEK